MTFGSATITKKDVSKLNGVGLDTSGGLAVNNKRVVHPAVDVTFTIGDESTNVRNVSVQLKDAFGKAIGEKVIYDLFVLAGASDALATGGSTGIADGGAGVILKTETSKQHFVCMTSAAGLSEFTWTDNGTESVRVAVKLPNGNFIISDAFANA